MILIKKKVKYLIDDNNKIENLIEYLKKEVNNFIIKTFDVEYLYKFYNNKTKKNDKRKEKIIFYGTKRYVCKFK